MSLIEVYTSIIYGHSGTKSITPVAVGITSLEGY